MAVRSSCGRYSRTAPHAEEEWGLVSHEEVSEWAAGTRDAMLISVSHPWETREHPDPCGDQLKRLVSCLSLYDAAYFSEIWVFYDFVSLFQYQQTTKQKQSFDRSMDHMHMLYAHECNWTVRLEALTPDDVWDAALQNSEHLVMVYDDESKTVRGRPLKELKHHRVPYRDRGWCKAEVEWSSCRSRSEQNQRIDAPGSEVSSEKELKGKVPMAPEVFQEDMKKAEFTHRKKDAAAVLKLQQDIYYEKVSACEEAVLANLPEGELGRLAKALKDYEKLKVLRLRNIEVGEAEAEEFCKARLCILLVPRGRFSLKKLFTGTCAERHNHRAGDQISLEGGRGRNHRIPSKTVLGSVEGTSFRVPEMR